MVRIDAFCSFAIWNSVYSTMRTSVSILVVVVYLVLCLGGGNSLPVGPGTLSNALKKLLTTLWTAPHATGAARNPNTQSNEQVISAKSAARSPVITPTKIPLISRVESPMQNYVATVQEAPAKENNLRKGSQYEADVEVDQPTMEPSQEPTAEPSADPSAIPTEEPSAMPTQEPTAGPTETPTVDPTPNPTTDPTVDPTASPTEEPTITPSAAPTAEPTADPTTDPTTHPTNPTAEPTLTPTDMPTRIPTLAPTGPSYAPTPEPSARPTIDPTTEPTRKPTFRPTRLPSVRPTRAPTIQPTFAPSAPTAIPTIAPTFAPTLQVTAFEFDTVFTFNLTTAVLSAADQKVICSSTGASMGINTSWVSFVSQGDDESRRLTDAAAAKNDLQQRALSINYYIINARVTTRFPLDGTITADQVYVILTNNMNNALRLGTFVNYLKTFSNTLNAGTTFADITTDDVSVHYDALILYGDPTQMPTRSPTYVKPDRLPNPELIGTLMGVLFGSILLATILYNGILYVRANDRDEPLMATKAVTQQKVREQVYLPVEIEEDVPRELDAVGKHALRREMALEARNKPKTGIVQIVFENQQL